MHPHQEIFEKIHNGIKEDKIGQLTEVLSNLKKLENRYLDHALSDKDLLETSVGHLFHAIQILEDLRSISTEEEEDTEEIHFQSLPAPHESLINPTFSFPTQNSFPDQVLEDLDSKLNRLFLEINDYVDRLGEFVTGSSEEI